MQVRRERYFNRCFDMKKSTFCVTLATIALVSLALPTMAQTSPPGVQTSSIRSSEAQSLWTDTNRAALKQALADSTRHGLDHVTFLPRDLDHKAGADADEAYQKAAMAYAHALSQGMVDPASLHDVYTISRPADQTGTLDDALRQNRLAQWLESLAPTDPDTGCYRKPISRRGGTSMPLSLSSHWRTASMSAKSIRAFRRLSIS